MFEVCTIIIFILLDSPEFTDFDGENFKVPGGQVIEKNAKYFPNCKFTKFSICNQNVSLSSDVAARIFSTGFPSL